MSKGNESAYPHKGQGFSQDGLTKRELFTLQLAAAHLASLGPGHPNDQGFFEYCAPKYVVMADLLISELQKKEAK